MYNLNKCTIVNTFVADVKLLVVKIEKHRVSNILYTHSHRPRLSSESYHSTLVNHLNSKSIA